MSARGFRTLLEVSALRRARPGIGAVVLVLIVFLLALVRLRLLAFPLERDEGEYAYFGQLILEGVVPYAEAYNMKFPGTHLAYALSMLLFGPTVEGIHLGLLAVSAATTIGLYAVARALGLARSAALVASASYGLLSVGPSVYGFAAHATHFVNVAAVFGTLLLLRAVRGGRVVTFLAAGAVLGLAPIMKQHGILFVAFGWWVVLRHTTSRLRPTSRRALALLGVFVAGSVAPVALMVVSLAASGVFQRFWFWTVTYALHYVADVGLSFGRFASVLSSVAQDFPPVWLLAAVGLVALVSDGRHPQRRAYLGLFVLFSLLSVFPGYRFRPHYFVTLLPAVALLAAVAVERVDELLASALGRGRAVQRIGTGSFVALILFGMIELRGYLFLDEPEVLCRQIYTHRPFVESRAIGEFIRDRCDPTDEILVLGSEPQIYFYSQRHAATGYVYVYALMERHPHARRMQDEFVRQAVAADPTFVVLIDNGTSWDEHPRSVRRVLDWYPGWLEQRYQLVGVADVLWPEPTVFRWYDDARDYDVRSELSSVRVYQRTEAPSRG